MSFAEWLQRKEVETVSGRHVEQPEGASSARRMHPGLWELFRVKAGLTQAYRGICR